MSWKSRKKYLQRWIFQLVETGFENLLSLRSFQDVLTGIPSGSKSGNYFRNVLDRLHIEYAVSPEDFAKIPLEGPVIVMSNHPLGGLDALLLGALFSGVRKDVKILGNYFLSNIHQLQDWNIPVSTSRKPEHIANNAAAIREAIRWVKQGGLLITFPTGDYSTAYRNKKGLRKRKWKAHAAGLVRLSEARVLPVYFPGKSSNLYQIVGLIHPRLRRNCLPRELVQKASERIDVFIGKPIPWKKLSEQDSDQQRIRYIQDNSYFLKNRLVSGKRKKAKKEEKLLPRQEAIIDPIPPAELQREIDQLPASARYAYEKSLEVYITAADKIPNVLREIGRLREVTFRLVKEGTGKAIDLDPFDNYYHHLFLWNRDNQELIGAYRLGLTDKILEKYGRRGLYTYTLFRFKPELMQYLRSAIEMGRSFIQQKYQKQYGMLLLLWKGIAQFIIQNPHYNKLFGPVSISNDYNPLSQDLIYNFLKRHKFDTALARHVRPRKPFHQVKVKGVKKKKLLSSLQNIEDVSLLISEIEKDGKGVPILLRHYLKLNASLLSFNVDKDFSNVLDGLILVDLAQTAPAILKRFMGKEGYQQFLRQQSSE